MIQWLPFYLKCLSGHVCVVTFMQKIISFSWMYANPMFVVKLFLQMEVSIKKNYTSFLLLLSLKFCSTICWGWSKCGNLLKLKAPTNLMELEAMASIVVQACWNLRSHLCIRIHGWFGAEASYIPSKESMIQDSYKSTLHLNQVYNTRIKYDTSSTWCNPSQEHMILHGITGANQISSDVNFLC